MGQMKTEREIDTEADALARMLPHVLATARCDHAAISAQIEVLRGRVSPEAARSLYRRQHKVSDAVRAAAIEASDWMFGRLPADAISPASDAATLCGDVHSFDPYHRS